MIPSTYQASLLPVTPFYKFDRPKQKKEKAPPRPEDYPGDLRRSRDQHSFRWDNPHSYSAALNLGYARQDVNTSKGFEHQGLLFGLAGGLRIPVGRWRRHVLLPRLFYEYQGINDFRIAKTTYLSHAKAHRFGIEANYLFEAVPTWLQVGGSLAVGLAHYRTRKGEYEGIFVNRSQGLTPLKSTGSQNEFGGMLCTINALACLKVAQVFDLGLRSGLEGVNTSGVSAQLVLDAMRIFHHPTPAAVAKRHGQQFTKVKRPR